MIVDRRPPLVCLMACGLLACGSEADGASLLNDETLVYPSPDWESAEPAALGMDAAALGTLAAAAEQNDSHCLVVTRKGRIVGEWYWDGWDADTTQPVFSVTKSFTGALVGIAQDQGLLDIEQPAADFIEEWQGSASADVTIRNLLSNDSGREWDFVTDYVSMASSAANKTQFAIDLGQDVEPGTHWEYNNSAIQTLERVLRVATGVEDVADFAQQHLFDPIGFEGQLGHDQAGNTLMFADLEASCRDLARFGYLYLRGGQWQSQQVVSREWVQASTTPSTALNSAYGYLFWLNRTGHYVLPSSPAREEGDGRRIDRAPESSYSALGLGGQMIAVDPEHDLVMTRIGGDANPLAALTSGGDLTGETVVVELSNMLADAIAVE